MLFVIRHTLG